MLERAGVVVDTNLWILAAGRRLPLAEIGRWAPGARLYVCDVSLHEIDRLDAAGVPMARAARRLAERAEILRAPGRGDAAILAAADRAGLALATADRELRAAALARGVPVLLLRGRGRLDLRAGQRAGRGKIMKPRRLESRALRRSHARRRHPPRPAGPRVRQRRHRNL
ncbi:MAG: hypothetical protein QXG65_05835 [Thermoplasmata archaeon]